MKVCCDASLVIPLHDARRPEHRAVSELWGRWAAERTTILAPLLLRYEVTNATYRSVRYGALSSNSGTRIIESLASMPIQYVDTYEMHVEAYEFARKFNAKTSYDGHYVALARREGISLFTADKKLANVCRPHFSFVQYVMEGEEPAS